MTRSILFFALIIIVGVLVSETASAYTTTEQRVQKINETTAIFFIDFAFGHENYDLYIPILTKRGQEHGTKAKTLGFEILEDREEPTDRGNVQALVLGKTKIENGMYKVPKGYKAPFTLAVVYTTDKALIEGDYVVQVTDLPFYRGDDMEYMHLNPSELQYYVTPEIELNSDNDPPVQHQG
ncbi:MAG: hypothetical protein WDZ93_03720 [Candidatus Paceibacterota bacterium]